MTSRARPYRLLAGYGPFWCALATALLALPVTAQEGAVGTGGVSGVVRDSSGAPIAGAEVTVRGSPVRIETDDHGEFRFAKVPAGQMTLRVRRIGFRPDTVQLMVLAGQTIPLDVRIRPFLVQLQAMVVYGRRGLSGRLAGFYARRERGIGHFVTRDEMEKRNPPNLTDMFRMIPGARVESRGPGRNHIRFRGAQCPPITWLDGTPLYAGEFDLDAISPRSLEGMEIYSGPSSVPAEFLATRSLSSSCGTIILWSREGELRPKKKKSGGPSAATEIAQAVEQRSLYTAEQVDRVASPDTTKKSTPVYPDSLYEAGVSGTVVAEFVVDITGEVNLDSFNVVSTTHPAFVESVRRALRTQQYFPAIKQGHPVMQVVHQPFSFVPDPSVARKKG